MAQQGSVMEQLRRLDEQRQQLLQGAKDEALRKAQEAVNELNELGFSYRLVEGGEQRQPRAQGNGTRAPRGDRRNKLLQLLRDKPDGMTRREILEAMDATSDKDQGSISNALSSMKKQGQVGQNGDRWIAA